MKILKALLSVPKRDNKKTLPTTGVLFLLPVLLLLAAISPLKWILDTEINGVEFYHSIGECNGKKVVFLKFNNKNNYKVTVSWKELFVTKQIRDKTAGFRGKKEMVLSVGETFASDCATNENEKLLILPIDVSPAYEAEIEKFEFNDISVTRVF